MSPRASLDQRPPKSTKVPEDGAVSDAVDEAILTATGITEIVAMIRSHYDSSRPATGCNEAIKAINRGLASKVYATTRNALAILDTLYRNCGRPFAVALAEDFTSFKQFVEDQVGGFLTSRTSSILIQSSTQNTLPENKEHFLKILAEWVALDLESAVHKHLDLTPRLRHFFEALVRAGYEFPEDAVSQLPPGTVERLKGEGNAWWRGALGVRFKTIS
ncbi:hypothetical protein BC830DRAFT_294374 [Chytriomyces sp. MP71]|nr:hypothetical protein BC830DRAFT_294374 [Chytriomyces sp. MP71]